MSVLKSIKYHLEPIAESAKALGMPIARALSARDENGIIAPNLLGYMPMSGEFRPPQFVDDVRSLWNKDVAKNSMKYDQQLHDDWGVGYTGSADEGNFNSDRDAAQFVGNFIPVPGGVPKLASYAKEVPGTLGKIARGAANVADTAVDFVLPAKSSGKPIRDMAKGTAMGAGMFAGATGAGAAYGALRGQPEPTADDWMAVYNSLMEEGDTASAEAALDEYYAVQARQK